LECFLALHFRKNKYQHRKLNYLPSLILAFNFQLLNKKKEAQVNLTAFWLLTFSF
jgi:hypothetical protein